MCECTAFTLEETKSVDKNYEKHKKSLWSCRNKTYVRTMQSKTMLYRAYTKRHRTHPVFSRLFWQISLHNWNRHDLRNTVFRCFCLSEQKYSNSCFSPPKKVHLRMCIAAIAGKKNSRVHPPILRLRNLRHPSTRRRSQRTNLVALWGWIEQRRQNKLQQTARGEMGPKLSLALLLSPPPTKIHPP